MALHLSPPQNSILSEPHVYSGPMFENLLANSWLALPNFQSFSHHPFNGSPRSTFQLRLMPDTSLLWVAPLGFLLLLLPDNTLVRYVLVHLACDVQEYPLRPIRRRSGLSKQFVQDISNLWR